MRVGISLASAQPGAGHAEAPARMIERARAAHRAGLHSLTVGDHHATGPMPYVQNVPVLGRLMVEWPDRPIGGLFLAAGWSPVLMAEQIGTLAAMAGGPFIVQTGLGGRDQMAALGVTAPHRGNRMELVITTVQRLLAGERVTDEALGLHDVAVAPLPPRDLEWWIGAISPPAIDRAARLGTGWYADVGLVPADARTQLADYVDACARHGRLPGTMALRRDVIIADVGDDARRLANELIDAGYRGLPREALVFGTPDDVAEQLAVYAEIGFTDIVIRNMTVPHETAVRSIELAGQVASLLAS